MPMDFSSHGPCLHGPNLELVPLCTHHGKLSFPVSSPTPAWWRVFGTSLDPLDPRDPQARYQQLLSSKNEFSRELSDLKRSCKELEARNRGLAVKLKVGPRCECEGR